MNSSVQFTETGVEIEQSHTTQYGEIEVTQHNVKKLSHEEYLKQRTSFLKSKKILSQLTSEEQEEYLTLTS